MKYMSHDEIRNTWFRFFKNKNHKLFESAPLVPINDNSLLWVNAGVTPLKKYFDGTEVPESRRLMSIQKCIRTNDIENVGDATHHTFFEMMGNFSVGDYFKEEAIGYAFELLTSDEYFGIPKEKLYVTVYTEDLDAKNRWIEVGFLEDHIIPLEGNFWEIGEGPCGPDSEIFYDRGEDFDKEGNAYSKFINDEDQYRYVEIWNNVFSQFNSKPGVDRKDYKELPSKNIDTGAGLERWCSIFQNVESNFDTDLFVPILKHIEELALEKYVGQREYKIIADHIRTIVFALADGASFENVGRGYVLRRLLRRSVRIGRELKIECPFMYKIVSDVVDIMKDAYPYLVEKRPLIEVKILEEEKLFLKTLESGEKRLKELIANSLDKTISGEDAFKLYDTYGFPFELTLELLEKNGFSVSKDEFLKYMNMQKELAKKNSNSKASMGSQSKALLEFTKESSFVYGLYRLKTEVIGIIKDDELVDSSSTDCLVIFFRTCFYAESGGQVSDTGMVIGKNFKARVLDVFKGPNGQHIHKVRILDGVITKNDLCEAVLDKERREEIEINHSCVHILQYSLQQVISKEIKQAGSYVDENKLRFDFTYSGKISDDTLVKVEEFFKEMISKDLIVSTEVMPLDKAKQLGAMALFSEKYKDMVRVVKIGKSIELCGGTHTSNTSKIKNFAIYNLESKGSNVYRIEAVTGNKTTKTLFNIIKPYNDEMIKLLMKAKNILVDAKKNNIDLTFDVSINNDKPVSYKDIIYNKNELSYIQNELKNLEKEYFSRKEQNALNNLESYRDKVLDYNGVKAIIDVVSNKDVNLLKSMADALLQMIGTGCVFFINKNKNNTVNFICRSNSFVNAGLVVKNAAVKSLGNGGGSNTFAQGGGKTCDKLEEIITDLEKVLKNE